MCSVQVGDLVKLPVINLTGVVYKIIPKKDKERNVVVVKLSNGISVMTIASELTKNFPLD